jgi:hypothetical protein
MCSRTACVRWSEMHCSTSHTMPTRKPSVYVIARTAIPPETLVEPFRRAVQSLDENLPAQDVLSLDDHIAQQRLNVTRSASCSPFSPPSRWCWRGWVFTRWWRTPSAGARRRSESAWPWEARGATFSGWW